MTIQKPKDDRSVNASSTLIDAVVDLSHWQAPVDFSAMKASGIVGVILKATQGSHWIDNTYATRVIAAQAAGLLVGAYHFCDGSPPETQTAHYLSVTSGIEFLAIDVEKNSIPGNSVSILQAAEIVSRIHMMIGCLPLVYIGRWGPDGRGTGLPNAILSSCPLWLPAYGARATCPPGWSNWMLWQHTDGTNGVDARPVPGVGKCDRSYYNGTVDQLKAWWQT